MEYPSPSNPYFTTVNTNYASQATHWTPPQRLTQHSSPHAIQRTPCRLSIQHPNSNATTTPQIDPILRGLTAQPPPIPIIPPAHVMPQPVPIEIGGLTWNLWNQKLIIYAMNYLGYSAEEVALPFQFPASENIVRKITVAQITAAYEHLKSISTQDRNRALWSQNDATLAAEEIYVMIEGARRKQRWFRIEQMKRE